MAEKIEFVRNYHDLSTEQGYQFEFYCDRCNSGYRTQFQASVTGTMNKFLDVANSLFGGALGRAADVVGHVHSAAWKGAHDEAFIKAVEEIRPDFIQCPHCLAWVCREKCWSTKKGICKHCAPDLGVEMSAAQASRSVEEVWAHAAMAEEDKKLGTEYWREGIRGTCPKCEAALPANVKFCPECGANVKAAPTCVKCGKKLDPGIKFCPECGEKVV